MARGRRAATGRGRPKAERETKTPQQSTDVSSPSVQADRRSAGPASLDAELRRQQHGSNLGFWRNLGKVKQSGRQSVSWNVPPAKPSRKAVDHGGIAEQYRLHTGPSTKRVLLFQYPDKRRNELANMHVSQRPRAVRIKPKSGVVEIDVPIPADDNCDKEKSILFGSASRKSTASQKNGAHGLAGGFGVGTRKYALSEEDAINDEPSKSALLDNFEQSVSQGYALDKFTLGGRIVPLRDGDPVYMVATFTATTCKWTKVDAIVQLRSQLHHLDALNEENRQAASSLSSKPEAKARMNRAEDVNVMVKDAGDNENVDMYGGMNDTARLLREMHNEKWQSLGWRTLHDDDASTDVYEKVFTDTVAEENAYLVSEMTNQQYLDAISCPRIDPIKQGEHVSLSSPSIDQITKSAGNDRTTSNSGPEEGDADATNNDDDHGNGGGDDGDNGSILPDAPSPELITRNDLHSSRKNDDNELFDQLLASSSQHDPPPEALIPDAAVERLIEQVCRVICLATSPRKIVELERQLSKQFEGKERFAFLGSEDKHHSFFRWRLGRNLAGEGVAPDEDCRID